MAKVTGPLMSLDASGTVGKTAVFSKWKGRNYVRVRVTPLNRRTEAQQGVRQKLGSIGYGNSFVLTPVGAVLGSVMYTAALEAAPAGQSWISFITGQIAGAGLSNWDTKSAAYALLSGTIQGYYDDAAVAAGIGNFSIAVPPETLASVTAGEILYHLAWEAVTDLACPSFGEDDPDSPTAQQCLDFADYVTEVTD